MKKIFKRFIDFFVYDSRPLKEIERVLRSPKISWGSILPYLEIAYYQRGGEWRQVVSGTQIKRGRDYYLKVIQDCILSQGGGSVQLKKGWNVVRLEKGVEQAGYVSERIAEWRDAVNRYNTTIASMQYFNRNIFTGVLVPDGIENMKLLIIK